MQEKKKMDSFRLRDVREVLSVEDLKEKVATVDGLMDTLEVSIVWNNLFQFSQMNKHRHEILIYFNPKINFNR